ncbi:MAG: hypothetical protein RLZ25_2066 [Pseudomonadota bacterium]|jgi:putative phage-type endonuclease
MKKIIELVQGTEAWHAHRARSLNASEAPVMLGISKYCSRSELLKQKATGVVPEIDPMLQRRFDDGHKFEAMARPWAEEIIGAELFPSTMSLEVDGLSLAASLDGITMMEDITFEHKTLNLDLAESLQAGIIPEEYHPQMEQGLMISGASKCLFMASKGNKEEALHAWYEPRPEVRNRLIAGWKQFLEDMKSWQPSETQEALIAQTPDSLPALLVQVEGRVVATNLDAFKTKAMDLIGGIKTELSSDQDFVDAEATVKFCKEAEERLELVKAQALAQTADIDAVFRAMDDIKEAMRRTRLELEKKVKSRKEEIRVAMIRTAQAEFQDYINRFNAEFGKPYLSMRADFDLAIKGKKSIKSCQDAIDTAMANAKIEASEKATVLRSNIVTVKEEHWGLLHDFANIGSLPSEQFAAILAGRIADDEQRRAAAAAAAQAKSESQVQAATQAQQKPAPTQPRVEEKVMPAVSKDDVDAFISINSFGKNEERVRQILTEFVSFQKSRQMQKAA